MGGVGVSLGVGGCDAGGDCGDGGSGGGSGGGADGHVGGECGGGHDGALRPSAAQSLRADAAPMSAAEAERIAKVCAAHNSARRSLVLVGNRSSVAHSCSVSPLARTYSPSLSLFPEPRLLLCSPTFLVQLRLPPTPSSQVELDLCKPSGTLAVPLASQQLARFA
eukprot:2902316-Pleurochrysis_carterae.AAC.4